MWRRRLLALIIESYSMFGMGNDDQKDDAVNNEEATPETAPAEESTPAEAPEAQPTICESRLIHSYSFDEAF